MTKRRNLFRIGTTQNRPYDIASGTGTEVDLRVELDNLFFGTDDNPTRHSWPVVIRNFRTDANNNKIPCTCWDERTTSHDPDCSFCFGEGFLADENWQMTYSHHAKSSGLFNKYESIPPGELRADQVIYYFRFDTQIEHGDKIVNMKLDTEGAVIVPYIREAIFEIETLVKHRSDNGRIEFITCYVNENSALRPDLT